MPSQSDRIYIMIKNNVSSSFLMILLFLFLYVSLGAYVAYAGELVKEAKGECHYQCQDTNTVGAGATTCTPTNEALAAVENKHKDPLHMQCEQKQCGTASYSGSGGSGQEDRCKEMPGMPPMLPMPMPMPKMPQPDECMNPEKAGTKECICKDPEKADTPECTEDKTKTDLNPFAPGEAVDESNAPRTIVEYGKSLFDKLFGNTEEAVEGAVDANGQSTTVRDVTGGSGVTPAIPADPGEFRSLQPPATPASPSLSNSSENSVIPTNTFGVSQDFETRAQAAEAPGGIVERIGAGARAILDNLRRFFGIGN